MVKWTEDDEQGGTQNPEQGATTTITFTIDGVSYTAEEGMTWEAWCGSPNYNTDGFWVSSVTGLVHDAVESGYVKNINGSDPISAADYQFYKYE